MGLDVTYVVMAIHTCFKSIFQMFHLFQLYVANVLSFCFKSRMCIAHVAMCAGGWWTAACRNRLMLLSGRRRDSRAGAGWAQQA
jgi:hypothetical protein